MQGDQFEAEGVSEIPEDHVGILLQQKRMEQGRELADIARQTRIPLRHLTAIESGNHDSLPALPYTIGFVKAYARSLGLDPEAIADRFRGETTKSDRIVPTMIHEPIEDARVPTRKAALLGIALFAVVVLAILAYALGAFDGDSDDEAPPALTAAGSDGGTPVNADTPPPPAVETQAAAPTTTATPAATVASGPVAIAAREDAWVKVYEAATGKTVFMGVMAAGDRYEVPADRQDLMLQTGRIGVLDFSVGGTALAPLGAPTEFVKDLALTGASLTARAQAAGGAPAVASAPGQSSAVPASSTPETGPEE